MMRSLGNKDKSSNRSLSTPKRTKSNNSNFQFQTERASEASSMQAMMLCRLNQTLESQPTSSTVPLSSTALPSPPFHLGMPPTLSGGSQTMYQHPVTHYLYQQAQQRIDYEGARRAILTAALVRVTDQPWIQPMFPPPLLGSVMYATTGMASPTAAAVTTNPLSMIQSLPHPLSCSSDHDMLTPFQVFLRHHIEAFAATEAETMSHIKGRNKRIQLHQVGIRCRHCAHISPPLRTKGAMYFPSSTTGFYQAAQNMSSTHLQCGACPAMPDATKTLFAQMMAGKTMGTSSVGGRAYWSQCATQLGLIDTDQGVFVRGYTPNGACIGVASKQRVYQTLSP